MLYIIAIQYLVKIIIVTSKVYFQKINCKRYVEYVTVT